MASLRRSPTRAARAMSIRHFGIVLTVAALDSAATSITSDIDLRWRGSLDTWVPAVAPTLIGKDTTSNRSYNFYLNTDGKLHFFGSSNGAGTTADATCSVATGFAAKTVNWVRATWRNSDNLVQFFTAPGTLSNPVAADFTQLGTDQTANLTGLFDGTALVEVGSAFGGTALLLANANTYRAQIRNGIDGTLVADFNPAVLKIAGTRRPSSFVDAVGQTWFTSGDWVTA